MPATDSMQSMTPPQIAVLGGGPAGLGAAYRLASESKAKVRLFEAGARVGGNAGSFEEDGVWCDFGSHRLHPASDPDILSDIKRLLGDDLLLRPRHGRIRLKDSWIHFPLKPVDLATKLPPTFSAALFMDAATAKLRAPRPEVETFGSVMLGGLGRTMCEAFYFPYMKKLWGLDPDELAPTLARRRVSGSSLPKLMRKIFAQLPGLRSETTGKFYYPRRGFGRICEAFEKAAIAAGADIRLGARVEKISVERGAVKSVTVGGAGASETVAVDRIWSTLPVSTLVNCLGEAVPTEIKRRANSVKYRGMILVYIVLATDQYTEYDAHYFPELSIPISRLSEPKNYSAATAPKGRTILCAELPSDPGDKFWAMDDAALGRALYDWLAACGLPQQAAILKSFTRRLPHAYPVYDRNYLENFSRVDEWIDGVEGLLTFGRQGLFAHDNTHHALAMAYAAAECLTGANFDRSKWAGYRREFETHVVED